MSSAGQVENPTPLGFPGVWSPSEIMGQPRWSARVIPGALRAGQISVIHLREAGEDAGRGPDPARLPACRSQAGSPRRRLHAYPTERCKPLSRSSGAGGFACEWRAKALPPRAANGWPVRVFSQDAWLYPAVLQGRR